MTVVISYKKLRQQDGNDKIGSGGGSNGKSVFCFAASSKEKEQSHDKIMVRMYMCTYVRSCATHLAIL